MSQVDIVRTGFLRFLAENRLEGPRDRRGGHGRNPRKRRWTGPQCRDRGGKGSVPGHALAVELTG